MTSSDKLGNKGAAAVPDLLQGKKKGTLKKKERRYGK